MAFVLGDYLAQLAPLGAHGAALYAAAAVVLLTGVNVVGTVRGRNLQLVVTCIEVGAIVAIILSGLLGSTAANAPPTTATTPATSAPGMAMIFVLLTYGGWSEAAYLSG